jgi:hypothetical protein
MDACESRLSAAAAASKPSHFLFPVAGAHIRSFFNNGSNHESSEQTSTSSFEPPEWKRINKMLQK